MDFRAAIVRGPTGMHVSTDSANPTAENAFEKKLIEYRSAVLATSMFDSKMVVHARVGNEREQLSIGRISGSDIGFVSSLTVAQICKYLDEKTYLGNHWQHVFQGILVITATIYDAKMTKKPLKLIRTPILHHQQTAELCFRILEGIFSVSSGMQAVKAMNLKCKESKSENADVDSDLRDLCDKHFRDMWSCTIEEVLSSGTMRKQFLAYAANLFPYMALHDHENYEMDYEGKKKFSEEEISRKELIGDYQDDEAQDKFSAKLQAVRADLRKFHESWEFRLECMRKVTRERKMFKSSNHWKNEAIVLHAGIMRCFKAKGNELNWDKGDITQIVYNINQILSNNVPSVDPVWQGKLGKLREKLMIIRKRMLQIELEDRDNMRRIICETRTSKEVEQYAVNLQRILIGEVYTVSGKHLSQEATEGIVMLAAELCEDITQRKIAYYSQQSQPNESKNLRTVQGSSYGVWRMIRETGDDSDLKELLIRIYLHLYRNGELLSYATTTGNSYEELLAENILANAICMESIRITNREENMPGVMARLKEELGTHRVHDSISNLLP